ncbi:MAG TPA: lecithin retinol acyltransferase family protein [Acidimicrobiales bacterium]|nr:lecithin retinol acyltransferase family protein [Acidimicrobiales bacterium]
MSGASGLAPGAHLRAQRGLYWHHGIYIGGDRVAQFGGRVKDKPHATIHAVNLDTFVDGDRVEVVDHTADQRVLWIKMWHADPLPVEQVVDRAAWLVSRPFPLAFYNLVGRNCEHVATWCATGAAESLQSRRRFLPIGMATLITTSALSRHPALLRRFAPPIVVATLLGWALPITYQAAARKLYEELNQYPGMGKWDRATS